MTLDVTSFEPALKQHYDTFRVENMVYKNHPFFAMVQKYKNFGGDVMKVPILTANPQNRSASFSRAIAGNSDAQVQAFLLNRAKNYSIASIENEVIEASKGDSNAFLSAATVQIDGAYASLSNDTAISLFRNGGGSIGRVGTSTSLSSAVIELSDKEDVTNFEVGMVLVFATTNTGTITVKATAGTENSAKVIAIDRMAGKVTVNVALDSYGSNDVAASDYIFVQGDVGAKLKGLQAWLPYGSSRASELSAPFFNVTRSTDETRLGGLYWDGSALSPEEALIEGASMVGREGGRPDVCFVNFSDYNNIVKSLGSKVQYVDVRAGTDGHIGFQGIAINGPKGVIKVIPDQDCPVRRAFLLQLDTWKLCSLGEPVRIFDTDGTKLLRATTQDALQVRCVQYAQLGCNAPGWNMQLSLAA